MLKKEDIFARVDSKLQTHRNYKNENMDYKLLVKDIKREKNYVIIHSKIKFKLNIKWENNKKSTLPLHKTPKLVLTVSTWHHHLSPSSRSISLKPNPPY